MNLFPFDLRILALLCGIYGGIAGTIKEYRKVKNKPYKQCFLFYVLAVFLIEVGVIWGIILIWSDFSAKVINLCSYVVFSWALACFSFSCYIFTDVVFNGDVPSVDKFEGKVAFGLGIYLTLVTIVSL